MAARCLHRAQASADGRYGAYPERGSGIHTELMLERLIAFGSLPLLVVALLAAGLGVPLPEDVVLLAAGVVSHRAALPWWVVLVTLYVSVLGSDSILYVMARRFGEPLLARRPLRWLVTPRRRGQVQTLLARHGGRTVFLGRHLGGLRTIVFALAAIEGVPFVTFLLWDALAALITVPSVFGLGYLFSAHVAAVEAGMARTEHWLMALGGLIALGGYVVWSKKHRAALAESATPPAP